MLPWCLSHQVLCSSLTILWWIPNFIGCGCWLLVHIYDQFGIKPFKKHIFWKKNTKAKIKIRLCWMEYFLLTWTTANYQHAEALSCSPNSHFFFTQVTEEKIGFIFFPPTSYTDWLSTPPGCSVLLPNLVLCRSGLKSFFFVVVVFFK